jgi:hypothetical protein
MINIEFGKEAPLTITREGIHDYLGMTLEYSDTDKVNIKVLDYVKKMLVDLQHEMDGEAPSPAANHLFTVDDKQTKVDEKKVQFFHTYVSRTLFHCKRARPDQQTAVDLFCTRVQSCDQDDNKKLTRMLQFLCANKDDFLTLAVDSLHNVRWWVDALYTVHPYMKSHGTSKRHKLNTQNSTESELVGVDDVMPHIMWTLFFLEAQGYKIDDKILYQDNKSSILLETNGQGSSGKRTRHIAVRYFFIADRVKSKEIRIEYCPNEIMIADYFTKPMQGMIFRQLLDMIMGNTPIALSRDNISDTTYHTSRIQAVSTQQESRSVLDNEKAIVNSLVSPLVMPAWCACHACVRACVRTRMRANVCPLAPLQS